MNTLLWIVAALGVLGAIAVVVRSRLGGRADNTDSSVLGKLAFEAVGAVWAERLSADIEDVRAVALDKARTDTLSVADLERLIECVELRFARKDAEVLVNVVSTYSGNGGHTEADLRLRWDEVPGDVRSVFLRSGTDQVTRTWSPHQPVSEKG